MLRNSVVPLHFERLGAGRSLIMVHGLVGANLRTWDPLLPALQESRELILIDLPGHGLSALLTEQQTFEAMQTHSPAL